MSSTDDLRKLMIESGIVNELADLAESSDDEQTWDTTQMQQEFEVLGFAAPFVVVRRRSDGARGTLTFRHAPRVYFDFIQTS